MSPELKAYPKILKVIESCITHEQLEVARRYFYLYMSKYNLWCFHSDIKYSLEMALSKKEDEFLLL